MVKHNQEAFSVLHYMKKNNDFSSDIQEGHRDHVLNV